jgi:SAM-dependent methyltransferase
MRDHNILEAIKTAWSEEYQRKGIPSSYRKDPTQVVLEFVRWAEQKGKTEGTAADIGCGQGRNSFYLAQQGFSVISLDLLEENALLVNEYAQNHNLPIRAYGQDAASAWPILPDSLEIAIDVFCYKHITDKKAQKRYRKSLWEALKPDGYYFISLASENDGYYGPLLANSSNPKDKLITDPHSGIGSFLYSLEDLSSEFSDLFEVVEANEKRSTSPMYGREFSRTVLNFVFKKLPLRKKKSSS